MAEPTAHSILCVDDDPFILQALERVCADEGWRWRGAASIAEAEAALAAEEPSCAVLDVELPGESGLDLLRRMRERGSSVPALMLTGRGYTVDNAMQAVRLGAETMLSKPVDRDDLVAAVGKALEKVELRRRLDELWRSSLGACGVVCASPAMRAVARRLELLLQRGAGARDAPLLLLGETGSGKSTLAAAVHRLSHRAAGPYQWISCANLGEQTFESEVFGHLRGSFTGAHRDKAGLVEKAAGGTLFLDEIQDLSLVNQRKLKVFVESRRFRRLGGLVDEPADVRLLCASNRDLAALAGQGAFLDDLLPRIGLLTVELPGLNERREDLPALAAQLLARRLAAPGEVGAAEDAAPRGWSLAPGALRALQAVDYRGENLRLLQKLLLRAQLFAADGGGARIEADHLRLAQAWDRPEADLARVEGAGSARDYAVQVEEFKRRLIREALARCEGKRVLAARELGLSLDNLCKKIVRYGIEWPG